MSVRVSIGRGWWAARRLEQHLILGSRFEMRRTSGHVFLTSLLILLRRADAATEDSPEFSNKGTFLLQTPITSSSFLSTASNSTFDSYSPRWDPSLKISIDDRNENGSKKRNLFREFETLR